MGTSPTKGRRRNILLSEPMRGCDDSNCYRAGKEDSDSRKPILKIPYLEGLSESEMRPRRELFCTEKGS